MLNPLFRIVKLVVLTLPHVSTILPTQSSVSRLIKQDASPKIDPLKTTFVHSKVQCTVHCLRTAGCVAFTYGSGYCRLMETKHKADDPTIETKKGFSYYHLRAQDVIKNPPELSLSTGYADFETAKKACENMKDGRLVCIHDAEMQKRVEDTLSQNNEQQDTAWVGLSGTVNSKTDYDLKWVDGQALKKGDYVHFYPEDPNGKGLNCVAMSGGKWLQKGDWVDDECFNQFRYVCEYQPGSSFEPKLGEAPVNKKPTTL